LALNRRLREASVETRFHFQTSSYIPGWAYGKALPRYIQSYKPDLVLVTLGANEIDLLKPEQRATAVARLVSKIGDRPCVWIAPPLWKPRSAGLVEVIRDHSGPCQFFDTNAYVPNLERVGDKIHPTPEASERWAAVLLEWLARRRRPTPERPWALSAE
jgi:lysophospholipase L1-like esterase